MTGTVSKHELKIWSTQTWSCLQTITLLVPPTTGLTGGYDSYLHVGVDLGASYLVLCDIARKVTFYLVIDDYSHDENDHDGDDKDEMLVIVMLMLVILVMMIMIMLVMMVLITVMVIVFMSWWW